MDQEPFGRDGAEMLAAQRAVLVKRLRTVDQLGLFLLFCFCYALFAEAPRQSRAESPNAHINALLLLGSIVVLSVVLLVMLALRIWLRSRLRAIDEQLKADKATRDGAFGNVLEKR
jgi:hypothetical protein